MAFIDTQLYIHQMISVKNFILAADLMKSISLLRYQEESKTLSLVSRDVKPLEVYSVEFLVDNNQLGFLVSDRDRNLLLYMYLPAGELFLLPSMPPSVITSSPAISKSGAPCVLSMS
ncbi:hypothetical protein AB205_0194970 [Aquarana catesbeiana]|uniref:RSE1/DDB1/CPSF1 C-terminal domain-containing protein n=1 Tax=Aquarana catesbeiana TaxID=8400 RepID=A0A2G9QH94_AQUCT|nr:hypothetical protein AB205_0194970 [Aquarana catesbeiana]